MDSDDAGRHSAVIIILCLSGGSCCIANGRHITTAAPVYGINLVFFILSIKSSPLTSNSIQTLFAVENRFWYQIKDQNSIYVPIESFFAKLISYLFYDLLKNGKLLIVKTVGRYFFFLNMALYAHSKYSNLS